MISPSLYTLKVYSIWAPSVTPTLDLLWKYEAVPNACKSLIDWAFITGSLLWAIFSPSIFVINLRKLKSNSSFSFGITIVSVVLSALILDFTSLPSTVVDFSSITYVLPFVFVPTLTFISPSYFL